MSKAAGKAPVEDSDMLALLYDPSFCRMGTAYDGGWKLIGRKDTREESESQNHGLSYNLVCRCQVSCLGRLCDTIDGTKNKLHFQQLVVEMRQGCHLEKKTQI